MNAMPNCLGQPFDLLIRRVELTERALRGTRRHVA